MRHAFTAAFVVAASVSAHCLAMSPVTVTKGPPASVEIQVHKYGVHEFYLTRPAGPLSYVPSGMQIRLTRGSPPKIFQVDLAYRELPDGRIYFRVDVPEEEASDYEIRVVDMVKGGLWYEIYSGKLTTLITDK